MSKKKIDKQKLVTRIVAAVLAGLMVLSIGFTLIWYLVAQQYKNYKLIVKS